MFQSRNIENFQMYSKLWKNFFSHSEKKKNRTPKPEGSRLSRLTEEIKDKEVKVHVVLSIKKTNLFQQTIFTYVMYSFDTSTRLMLFLK